MKCCLTEMFSVQFNLFSRFILLVKPNVQFQFYFLCWWALHFLKYPIQCLSSRDLTSKFFLFFYCFLRRVIAQLFMKFLIFVDSVCIRHSSQGYCLLQTAVLLDVLLQGWILLDWLYYYLRDLCMTVKFLLYSGFVFYPHRVITLSWVE